MYRVMFDCDGVLADFDKHVNNWHPGHTRDSMKMKDFWAPLSKVPEFFYQLDKIPAGAMLYRAIKNLGVNIEILTALPIPTGYFVDAAKDKERWVHEYIDSTVHVNTVVGGKNKAKYFIAKFGEDAIKKAILIDDYQRNIDIWNEAGGIGIYFQPNIAETVYQQVKDILDGVR